MNTKHIGKTIPISQKFTNNNNTLPAWLTKC